MKNWIVEVAGQVVIAPWDWTWWAKCKNKQSNKNLAFTNACDDSFTNTDHTSNQCSKNVLWYLSTPHPNMIQQPFCRVSWILTCIWYEPCWTTNSLTIQNRRYITHLFLNNNTVCVEKWHLFSYNLRKGLPSTRPSLIHIPEQSSIQIRWTVRGTKGCKWWQAQDIHKWKVYFPGLSKVKTRVQLSVHNIKLVKTGCRTVK